MPPPLQLEREGYEWMDVAEGAEAGENNAHALLLQCKCARLREEQEQQKEPAGKRNRKRLQPLLEEFEAPFQLKLLASLFARIHQRCARSRGLLCAELGATRGPCTSVGFPWSRLLPQTVPGQEAVSEPGAHHLLEVAVGERVGHGRTNIFMSHIDAGDPFIIGRESYGHVVEAIHGQRVVRAFDVENDVVAGEVDLGHHTPGGHLLEQLVGTSLLHYVDAMANAFGMPLFHGRGACRTHWP